MTIPILRIRSFTSPEDLRSSHFGEHPPMTKGMIMNMLAKFDPFTRMEPLDLFRPSFRADTFRDMEDIVRNMQRTFPPWAAQAEELMTHTEWRTSVYIRNDEVKY